VEYGAELLELIRAETERRWFDPYPGLGWQPGTHWRGGLPESELRETEDRFGLRFPPDYRLFLQTLHTTDPERALYVDGTIVATSGRPFRDWRGDRSPIDQAMDWPLDGLMWSIEADDEWIASWGERPTTEAGRAERIRSIAAAGPPLIPVGGHRYLVGAPLQAGNPVLSIYGADVIVYSPTFGAWLVEELATILDPSFRDLAPEVPRVEVPIPFWQDVIDGT
jgi:hypothetical protein